MTPTTFNLRAGSLPKTVGYDGTIRGVSVITTGPARGHGCSIDTKTLSQVVSCGGRGVPVKMDHSDGLDRIVGSCRNFSVDGNQVRADIQLLKSHGAFGFIKELVEKQSDTFGLSVSFACTLETVDKEDFVRCTQLYSVDLVDLPAANPGGLFSRPIGNTPVDYVGLAEKLYPSDLTSLRRICKTQDELSNRCARLFYLDGLASIVGGIDTQQMLLEVGEPRKLFGLQRCYFYNLRAKLIEALKGEKPAPEQRPLIDPKLKGLERAYAAHALATAGNPSYK